MPRRGSVGRISIIATVSVLTLIAGPADAGKRVHWGKNDGAAPKVIFSKSGLKLRATCDGLLGVKVRSTRRSDSPGIFGATSQSQIAPLHHYLGVDGLHRGTDGFELLAGGDSLNAFDSGVGQIIHADRRRVTSIDWLSERNDALGKNCVFGGIATSAKRNTARGLVFRANEDTPERRVYSDFDLKVDATCTSADGLDVEIRSNGSGVYAASQSDADDNGTDEQGFAAYEGFDDNDPLRLDASGVADDNAAGQILINTSNVQLSLDWVGTSSGALGRDCAFAATVSAQTSASNRRIVYAPFGNDPVGPFFALGGMELSAGCNADDLTLLGGTTAPGSAIHAGTQSDADANSVDSHLYIEDDVLNPGDQQDIVGATEDRNVLGQIVHASPGGSYATADFMADEGDLGGGADCGVFGTADRAAAP